jgi:CrcB protein
MISGRALDDIDFDNPPAPIDRLPARTDHDGYPKISSSRKRRMYPSLIAIGLGAALGALLRWLLALRLNAWVPALPMGTLAANLLGGYLIGIAMAFFAAHSDLPPHWRLFVMTGFLGGLTTFSTFSAEVTSHLQEGRLLWAFALIAVHVIGSLAMTFAGIATVTLLQKL